MALTVELGQGAWLPLVVLDGETPTDADANTVTCDITYWDGTTSNLDVEQTAVGTYRAQLPTTSTVAPIAVSWHWDDITGPTRSRADQVNVIGGHLFELPELRAMPDLSNSDRYTTDHLIRARDWAEAKIANAITVPPLAQFTERTFTDQQVGDRCQWHHRYTTARHYLDLYAVDLAGVYIDGVPAEGITLDDAGRLVGLPALRRDAVVRVGWARAFGSDVPADLHETAIKVARWWLLTTIGESGIPDRATSIVTAEGTQQLAVAGRYSPIGFPDADVVLNDYFDRYATPGIA